MQCLAGQHVAGVGGGKHNHFGDFFGIARPSQRHRAAQLFEVFLGGTGFSPHRGMHRARCDDGHHDAVFRFFKRQHLAELDNRGFRRAIDDYLRRERPAVEQEIEELMQYSPFRKANDSSS